MIGKNFSPVFHTNNRKDKDYEQCSGFVYKSSNQNKQTR